MMKFAVSEQLLSGRDCAVVYRVVYSRENYVSGELCVVTFSQIQNNEHQS